MFSSIKRIIYVTKGKSDKTDGYGIFWLGTE